MLDDTWPSNRILRRLLLNGRVPCCGRRGIPRHDGSWREKRWRVEVFGPGLSRVRLSLSLSGRLIDAISAMSAEFRFEVLRR